jgi:hypothetical protein
LCFTASETRARFKQLIRLNLHKSHLKSDHAQAYEAFVLRGYFNALGDVLDLHVPTASLSHSSSGSTSPRSTTREKLDVQKYMQSIQEALERAREDYTRSRAAKNDRSLPQSTAEINWRRLDALERTENTSEEPSSEITSSERPRAAVRRARQQNIDLATLNDLAAGQSTESGRKARARLSSSKSRESSTHSVVRAPLRRAGSSRSRGSSAHSVLRDSVPATKGYPLQRGGSRRGSVSTSSTPPRSPSPSSENSERKGTIRSPSRKAIVHQDQHAQQGKDDSSGGTGLSS